MGCENPQWIYLPKYLPIRNAEHETNQKLLRKPLWHYTPRHYAIQIPCGTCAFCRIQHAREHAIKSYCEMQDHQEGCFITLTYNNGYRTIKGQENELSLPLTEKGQEKYNELIKTFNQEQTMKILAKMQEHSLDIMLLKKKDLQDFWKRLRKYLDKENIKIRYLACGERGEDKKRVHFHAVIFGWKPKDLEKYKINHQNEWIYKSKTLQKIWGCGFCTVGELNYETASYTARYVQKKAGIEHKKRKRNREFIYKFSMEETCKILDEYCTQYDKRELTKNDYIQYFMKLNSINRIIKDKNEIENEFITASNRPGIGLNYFIKNLNNIKKNNGILIHVKKKTMLMSLPKYYKNKWKEINAEEFYNWAYQQQLKAEKERQRKINSLNYPKNYTEWQKEMEYTQHEIRNFKSKIKRLIRVNLEKDTI